MNFEILQKAIIHCAIELPYNTTVPDAFYALAKRIKIEEELEGKREEENHRQALEAAFGDHGQR